MEQLAREVYAMARVLGLTELMDLSAGAGDRGQSLALERLLESLLAERAQARAQKNWEATDRIRDLLADAGVVIHDSAQGSGWSLG